MAVPANATQNAADLLAGVTGFDFTAEEIHKAGERINNLAAAFNCREGFSRRDDTLPERLMSEPVPGGASKGHFISRQELDLMLDEYYAARGWDRETGAPSRAKLEELGLAYAADQLGVA
jgi:aldehyde:ferredoxin oxidoreductase